MATVEDKSAEISLEDVIASLRGDYSHLSARLRELQHTVACEFNGVTLRLHFPAFRQGNATITELVEAVSLHITNFALTREEITSVDQKYGTIPATEFRAETTRLNQAAIRLFIKTAKATGRNGECGELLLYLLTEWKLNAPQIISKMSLKTNPAMPVHGSDGVHARYCATTKRLYLYWGEAKLHADVNSAISDAAKSISTALSPSALEHEVGLVRRNINFSGLDDIAKTEILEFLNPMTENYNKRFDVVTCLIGFNFDGYQKVGPDDGDDAEQKFGALAEARLKAVAPTIASNLKNQGLEKISVEFFLLPVPSVQDLRDFFQAKIGWKDE